MSHTANSSLQHISRKALHMTTGLKTLGFEDFSQGHFGTFGPYHALREDIIAFAAEFDPQPMHLDEEAAKHSLLQGLAGSGWHLCSIAMRMMCDGFLLRTACLGSPGVDEVKWLAPLRPGDDLTLDVEIVGCRVSSSRPELGFVHFKNQIRNADGQLLLVSTMPVIILRRDAIGGASR
jgi:acyl dehydratase